MSVSNDAMKKHIFTLFHGLVSAEGGIANVVSYWNFNSLFITAASISEVGSIPTSIAAIQGTGTL